MLFVCFNGVLFNLQCNMDKVAKKESLVIGYVNIFLKNRKFIVSNVFVASKRLCLVSIARSNRYFIWFYERQFYIYNAPKKKRLKCILTFLCCNNENLLLISLLIIIIYFFINVHGVKKITHASYTDIMKHCILF